MTPVVRLAMLVLLADPASAAEHLAGPFAGFEHASGPVLSNPHDLAFGPDGQLYVADLGHDRIAIIDPETLMLTGEIGAGLLSEPHDVAFDAAGRMLVADTGNSRIAIFEGDRLIAEFAEGIRRPEGVMAHPDGRIIATGTGNNALVAYDADGALLARYQGQLLRPHDVALAPDGRIWLADAGNDRLLILDADLALLETVDDPAHAWDGPRYLDFDGAGNPVVADKNSHRIKRLGAGHALTGSIGEGAGQGPGLFRTPEGVAIADGTYWFSDSGNDRVVRYRALTH